jgi:dTMP kinase
MKQNGPSMRLLPHSLIVFEGPDDTGKSTLLNHIKEQQLFEDAVFTHQPSGETSLGDNIYLITETFREPEMTPLTRQFLHLASHAEHYANFILPKLEEGGVFLDRCWWSTIAYGWYAGGINMEFDEFFRMVTLPTGGKMPSIVFLSMNSFSETPGSALLQGYWELQEQYLETTVLLPVASVSERAALVADHLIQRGLAEA